ncbi:mitochondrial RNA polymerase [Leptinotarsa decemlineata]|uniref:mitochondrial RNA polymerase n=1 Tax=Leptinotarsa decemlineata TaxID=7539 RepID=UPI003D3054FB
MYSLLKLNRPLLPKLPKTSLSVFNVNNDSKVFHKTGLFCKEYITLFDLGQIRHQTTAKKLDLEEKRRRRKQKKYFADVLVVTDNASSQKKATVKKLTVADLKLLASTNLNLSELYRLKELSKKPVEEHTYNNLNVIENFLDTKVNFHDGGFIDSAVDGKEEKVIKFTPPGPEIIKKKETNNNVVDEEFESFTSLSSFQPAPEKEYRSFPGDSREKAFIIGSMKGQHSRKYEVPMDRERREEITNKTLGSYIEVCSQMGNPQRGLAALNFHRFKVKKYNGRIRNVFVPITNIKVYNAVLKGFAHKGDFEKLSEVVQIVKEDGHKLNVQSYVAIFECLGRINVQNNHLKNIEVFSEEALSNDITYDKIMNEGSFLNNERELVLKAMRCVDPTYVPKYNTPVLCYKNSLVDHLNIEGPVKLSSPKEDGNYFLNYSDLCKKIEQQIELEKAGTMHVKNIAFSTEVTDEVLGFRASLEKHFKMWEESALAAYNRDLSTLIAQKSTMNMDIFLRCLPAKDYIEIILDEVRRLIEGSETYSPTVNMLYKEMGWRVYTKYKIFSKEKTGVLDKISDIHKSYCSHYAASHDALDVLPKEEVKTNPRREWQWIDYTKLGEGATLNMDHRRWTPSTLVLIGKFLYQIIMFDLKVDVNLLKPEIKHKSYLPAFYTVFRMQPQTRYSIEEVKPHPLLSKLVRQSFPETLTFTINEMPMVCPPVPWISTELGGYLLMPSEFIRLPVESTTQRQRLREVGPQQLYPNFDALNQLAAVPWKVNKKVLDVVLHVFKNGGSSELNVPEAPEKLEVPTAPKHEMSKLEKYQLFKEKIQYKVKKAEMYSLWCECLYRLSLANHFRDTVFWLPHNMDFRGRVYPIPPHLNHLGSDLARSLLIFAEARPLGPDGLDWLKIHLVNLTGLKKREPIRERLNYANKNIDSILESADNPLSGSRWWLNSDDPWQTLACCMEIAEAVRSPDPEKYMTHFAIHQDGSCNGLQHYAALGRDTAGAHSVNLTRSDTPQDVYSTVVNLVEEQRAEDAEDGHEIAKILEGFIKRKVIKQTVMTTVYGVTKYGAKLQIIRQLKDIPEFPKQLIWPASTYLTALTFESLRTMFTSTREIQDWFTESAKLISSVGGQYVEWVTPLGLPIVQPYAIHKKYSVGPAYETYFDDKFDKPKTIKQKNAFPPNFIHSLDSSHMMLTSIHCERAGITFVSVHDCYWTHPSTVNIMNKICREQFVRLHSHPILENLSEFLYEKYSLNERDVEEKRNAKEIAKKKLNKCLRNLPNRGTFDINEVLESVYFFS